MVTVVFGRSDAEFWDMTPRLAVTMIEEWGKIEKQRAKMQGVVIASYMNGKDPDVYLEPKPKKLVSVSREQAVRNARMLF